MIQTIYDIVKAHGGDITVKSLSAGEAGDEQQGTTFTIQIPVSQSKTNMDNNMLK